jgi:hypothetical protein
LEKLGQQAPAKPRKQPKRRCNSLVYLKKSSLGISGSLHLNPINGLKQAKKAPPHIFRNVPGLSAGGQSFSGPRIIKVFMRKIGLTNTGFQSSNRRLDG